MPITLGTRTTVQVLPQKDMKLSYTVLESFMSVKATSAKFWIAQKGAVARLQSCICATPCSAQNKETKHILNKQKSADNKQEAFARTNNRAQRDKCSFV